jgi:sugar diacid utilization regulator
LPEIGNMMCSPGHEDRERRMDEDGWLDEPEDQLPGTSLTRLPRAAVLAAADARLRVSLLGDYLEVLAAAAGGARRLTSAELERFRSLGRAAAESGAALRALVDLYLSATWRAWPTLPGVRGARDGDARGVRPLRAAGSAVLRASDDVVAALCEGYESARQARARAEEALRREVVDGLLTGASDVGSLIERAAVFGLRLEAPHVVLVVRANRRLSEGRAVTRDVEAALRARQSGQPDVLVAAKDGMLVCVIPEETSGAGPLDAGPLSGAGPLDAGPLSGAGPPDARAPDGTPLGAVPLAGSGGSGGSGTYSGSVATVAERLGREPDLRWRIGVSRGRAGVAGVHAGFEEARWAIDVAALLDLPDPVARAGDLLVYQVLLRDRPALEELVTAVLTPLREARGGARPLLATLDAYFAEGGVTLAAARRLHLSPRALTYRLVRIGELTGHDPTNPADRYVLQTAALGARLLAWSAEIP